MASDILTKSVEPETSTLFNDPNADITYQSSNNVLFKIYKKHLESNTGRLTVPAGISSDLKDIVVLEESSDILELLFQFIHPRSELQQFRQPPVVDMEPSTFFALAEAAEKYIVFGAMNVCTTCMHYILSEYPIEILNHSARHGYSDLADKAAVQTIGRKLDRVVAGLTHPGVLAKWVLYYHQWVEKVESQYKGAQVDPSFDCPRFIYWSRAYQLQMVLNPGSGINAPPLPNIGCTCHTKYATHTCQIFINQVSTTFAHKAAAIPKFSSM